MLFFVLTQRQKITKEKSGQTLSLRAFCFACALSMLFLQYFLFGCRPLLRLLTNNSESSRRGFHSMPRRALNCRRETPTHISSQPEESFQAAGAMAVGVITNNRSLTILVQYIVVNICVYGTPLLSLVFTFLCLDTKKR